MNNVRNGLSSGQLAAGGPSVDTFKSVTFNEHTLNFCGRVGDPYFDGLNLLDASHSSFVKLLGYLRLSSPVILDVGANLGITSAMVSRQFPDGIIHAFEPSPAIYPYLLKNMEKNNLSNCHPHNFALAAEPGKLAFMDNATSASASHLVRKTQTLSGTTTIVDVSTIDHFVAEMNLTNVDLIKIDVEGFECEVIEGSLQTITKFSPHLFVEYNSYTLIAFGNKNPRVLIDLLLKNFPHVYHLENEQFNELRSPESINGFIHDNLLRRSCVDDLYCTHARV